MKKQSVYLTHDGILMVNNKAYIGSSTKLKDVDGIKHVDKELFKEPDIQKFDQKVDFIVKKIKDSLEKEEIIRELVIKTGPYEVNKVYKIFKKAKKKKKITKQKGCLGLKIGSGKPKTGGGYLELID